MTADEILANRVDQMEKGFENQRVTLDRVLIILDGEEKRNASGEVTREGGISKDVADLKVAMNGGKMGVKARDKVVIGTIAAVPSLALMITNIVSRI